jgi:sortase A
MLRLRRARRSRARLAGVLVLILGALLTSGIGGGWWWTNWHARYTAHQLADQAISGWGSDRERPAPAPEQAPKQINGKVVAVVRAPRLGQDWRMPVQKGTGRQILREGLGLYTGSPLPGQLGNVALAGHRTTWGAPLKHLDQLRKGDVITIWTATGRFDYQVRNQGVTVPSDTSVIQPAEAKGKAMLTLTTCNPEFSARERLYVHAVLTHKVIY